MKRVLFGLLMFASSFSAIAKGEIKDIFTTDMIGADVSYLEQFTGPARQTDTTFHTKTYKVSSCEVTANLDQTDKSITSLSMKLSGKCTFDVNPFLPNAFKPFPTANKITFESFENATGGGKFLSDCLTSCGNGYAPSVYEYFQGSHADNYINILVSVEQINDKTIDAGSQWAKSMAEKEGVDWVIDTQFNCTAKYDGIATKLFSTIKIDSITVGNIQNPFENNCK